MAAEKLSEFTRQNYDKIQKTLLHERSKRQTLENTCEELAQQLNSMERNLHVQNQHRHSHGDENAFSDVVDKAQVASSSEVYAMKIKSKNHHFQMASQSSCQSDESLDMFFDAFESTVSISTCASGSDPCELKTKHPTDGSSSVSESDLLQPLGSSTKPRCRRLDDEGMNETKLPVNAEAKDCTEPLTMIKRRTTIPPRATHSLKLWNVLKMGIGKELTKIPMPVNFNEPISMLQRLCEKFEYSSCLDAASKCTDSIVQMAYIAAFAVSPYSSTEKRIAKPFNPLLGETYECNRLDDMGWRYIAEQVRHHPPTSSLYCESLTHGWVSFQEFSMTSKFRGTYMTIIPKGLAHITFANGGSSYSWGSVNTTAHNIIVGKLWIDNHGDVEIHNHATDDVCHMSFKPYSYLSRNTPRRVMGVIYDKDKTPRYMLRGTWNDSLSGAHITSINKDEWETGPWELLWKRKEVTGHHGEDRYFFSPFAIQLNELLPNDHPAPTDSRYRPDQRLMELGRWDEANQKKEMLEEKQRAARRKREKNNCPPEPEPIWFKPQVDSSNGLARHAYAGQYWACKESGRWPDNLPDIF